MPTIAFTMIGHNEAHNLPRSLGSVQWADQLIYVDCASTDGSVEVARRYTPHVFSRPNVANLNVNKAFGIEQADTDWVFYLDADEVIGPELAQDIRDAIAGDPPQAAFDMPRRNYFFGAWVRHGGHYPDPQLRLFRRGRARFALEHVHEKLQVDGSVGRLRHALEHYTVDSALTALRKMDFNSSFNAMDMARRGRRPSAGMAFSYLCWKPLSRFVRRYGFKGGFLDGWPGLLVAVIDCIDFPFRFIKFWYWATHPQDCPHPSREQATP